MALEYQHLHQAKTCHNHTTSLNHIPQVAKTSWGDFVQQVQIVVSGLDNVIPRVKEEHGIPNIVSASEVN
jgi:hypothetical protein